MATATWKCLVNHDGNLQRSSHIVSVVNRHIYVFGGELVPRQPRDNKLFDMDLNGEAHSVEVILPSTAPSPRVGSASATLGDSVYLFSGRGGTAMAPIDDGAGAIWQFNIKSGGTSDWALLKPKDESAIAPPARSYHCMTSDGKTLIYLHAGCPEKGRLSDLWAFDVSERVWTQLPDAPAPSRGGTSIAYSDGKLFRMNGFDGQTEQGGSLDVFDIGTSSWSTLSYTPDGKVGPEARSVAALLALKLAGKSTLLTLFGERDPSSLGHAGAGKMLGDFWLYDTDADSWTPGHISSGDRPAPRGWFDADVIDESSIVISGGLNEANERLGDIWSLSF